MGFSLLLLGLALGMRHALEADHLAAVACIASREIRPLQALRHGILWGVGHTLSLFALGSLVLLADGIVPAQFASALELAVGVMLIILGIDVLRRMRRQRVHFHHHKHSNGIEHFHAHAHGGDSEHNASAHRHSHPQQLPKGALFVGLMHGMAGTAALIVLALDNVSSPLQGLLYIAVFGVGSIIGMAMLSLVVAIPLRYSARGLTGLHNALQICVALISVTIGGQMIIEHSAAFQLGIF